MLLVYTNKITPRLKYIFKHYFIRILQIPVSFTTKVEEFVAHSGPKISYSKAPLGTEFFIRSNDLLFEQGINDIEINVLKWDDVACFFPTGEKSTIPFDIFAAGFYLISRYEEYLPHVQDEHERFPSQESIAFKNNFLEKPVIDIWAYKLLDLLKEYFPNYDYKTRKFKYISTFDVDNAYAYKNKGIVRTIGGFANDVFQLRLVNFWNRLLTVLNFRNDPFDTYNEILRIHKKYNIETLFFVSLGDYTTFDKNVSSSNSTYKSLLKSLADYVKVGLHPSYFTLKDEGMLKKEKIRLEQTINTPVKFSRQHYLRFSMPETYHTLLDLDILEDHTMGYAKQVGFRASTCTPFYFYDLDFEIQTPLKVFPFAFMDGALKVHMDLSNEDSFATILKLIDEVKNVNGTFISLLHNDTVSNKGMWEGWKVIYRKMVKELV